MKFRTLTLCALGMMALASTAEARKNKKPLPQPVQPIVLGDTRMNCDQLATEANAMQTILGGAPEAGMFGGEMAARIGETAISQGLLHSGMAGKMGGRAGGAISLLGRAAKDSGKRRAEAEAARKESAQKRWYYIVGLYQGGRCDQAPAPVAAPAQAVAPAQGTAPATETAN
ncbi:MAG: hypothetical protein Q9M33_06085 [Robiginitomaculum sp.]|nr:hypothetical protein [Robiginitomaculum sp.]MDQ7078392.1 hypothetical protein [Robiginitomaculum sp.]